jgi:hypothetical protein
MTAYYWLSFADAQKPKGSQFLGARIIEGVTLMAAIKAAHIMGLNPGGEVQAVAFQVLDEKGEAIMKNWKESLLTEAQCEALDFLMTGHVKAVEGRP